MKNIYNRINNFLKNNLPIFLLLCLFFLKSNGVQYFSNIIAPTNAMARVSTYSSVDNFDSSKTLRNTANLSVNKLSTKIDKKIVKNVNLSIEVKNFDKKLTSIKKFLDDNGAIINNYYSYEYYNKSAYNFSIMIDSKKLEDTISFLKNEGIIKNESLNIQDKTENYLDNENRLKNLYIRRDSLRDLMKEEAKKVSDIITIEKELSNVQYEIENYEKSNKKLQKSVDYSGINLTLLPEVVLNTKNNSWKFNKSINSAINLLISFCRLIVDTIIILVVFLPIIFILFFFYRIYLKYKKNV